MSFGEAYLHDAARLVGRDDGQPWGRAQESVVVAGRSYCCRGLSEDQAAILRRRYGRAPAVTSPTIDFELVRAAAGEFKPVEPAGWEYSFDLEPHGDRLLLAGWDFAARITLRPRLDAVMWSPHADGGCFELAFSNVLRVVVAYALLEAGGVLLHSAAVVDGGGAVLFVGVSGAGKSTVSRRALESGRAVLSDDLNAVVREGGRAWVQQVPFTGDLGPANTVSGRFPLARVLRLRKGETAALRAMGRAEVLALLAGCSPYVNVDPVRREQLLGNLEGSLAGVPADELTFPRDGGFWHLPAEERAS